MFKSDYQNKVSLILPLGSGIIPSNSFDCHMGYQVLFSVAVFILTMNKMFGLEIYVDDMCCCTEPLEEHLGKPEIILDTQLRKVLTLKLNKCNFVTKEIRFLGHIVSGEKLLRSLIKTTQ